MRRDGEDLHEIEGFPGYYITRSGRVYSRRRPCFGLFRRTGRYWAKVNPGGGQIHLGFFDCEEDAREAVRSWRIGRGEDPDLRLLKPRLNTSGYRVVNLWVGGKINVRPVHRILAEAFIPNLDGHPLVRHYDDDKLNNSLGNLVWGTPADNMRDKARNAKARAGRAG